jgi:hypothetical protein
MLKISRIRPCEYNKSCSNFHSKSGSSGGAPGRGTARGRVHAHLGRVGARRLGGEGTDGGARRWPAVTAAAARAAAKFRAGKFNVRP